MARAMRPGQVRKSSLPILLAASKSCPYLEAMEPGLRWEISGLTQIHNISLSPGFRSLSSQTGTIIQSWFLN